ncbi:hypothetical protein ACFDR9_000936 [Janthinobacterium sp. CG_23.3]|uniref:hypothetical protein n=1 Tax=Janthinobacterium sp. CG_23.3 TaxID=3349634 RepID=UPI0038D41C72
MAIRLFMALCATGLWCGAALADCTARDRRDMREGGMNEARIRHFCSTLEHRAREAPAPASAASASRQSNICLTQLTSCALNRAGAVGATCWCNTAAGPARGRLAEQ